MRRYILAIDEPIRQGDRFYFESTPDLDMKAIRSDIKRTPSQVEMMRSMLPAQGSDRIVFFREVPSGEGGAPVTRATDRLVARPRPRGSLRKHHILEQELRGARRKRRTHRTSPMRLTRRRSPVHSFLRAV